MFYIYIYEFLYWVLILFPFFSCRWLQVFWIFNTIWLWVEVFLLIFCFIYSSFLLATSLFLVILGFPGKAEPVLFSLLWGAALRGTAGISDSASSLTMDLGGAAPVLCRPTGMYCYILPPSWRGLELWGSRLHLSGCTMSSVLWELACSRTRCPASPLFFCPSESQLVLPIRFTQLALIFCQCPVSGTEVDAPKDPHALCHSE